MITRHTLLPLLFLAVCSIGIASAVAQNHLNEQRLPDDDLELTLTGPLGPVYTAVWSPDGSIITSTNEDGKAKFWNTTTGALLPILPYIYSAGWNPDGSMIATINENSTGQVWDASTLKLLWESRSYGLLWSPDGKRVLVGSDDHTAKIWDVAADTVVQTFTGHTEGISDLAWSPDGNMIATAASGDSTARIWDVATGNSLHILRVDSAYLYRIAWNPRGNKVAITASNPTARVWDAATGLLLYTLAGHADGYIYDMAWSPNGTMIATAGSDRTARIWDAATGAQVHNLPHTGMVTGVAWSPDGSMIATCDWDSTARIWDPSTGRVVQTLIGHHSGVFDVAWSPDGTRIATAGRDYSIKIWRVHPSTSSVSNNDAGDGRRLTTLFSTPVRLVRLYPNPSTQGDAIVEVAAEREAQVSLRVISVLGEELVHWERVLIQSGNNLIELPLPPTAPNGAYQLIVESSEGRSVAPIVIQR